MSPINYLEPRFGRYAIPHLVQGLAVCQVVVWVLLQILAPEKRVEFVMSLMLHKGAVLDGEVWRLLTFMLLPRIGGVIWVAFFLLFALFMGDVFEKAWGAFRINIYIIGGWLAVVLGVMIFDVSPSLDQPLWISSSIFFAFAVILPDYPILAYFVIPVKAWHLALLNGAAIILQFVDSPSERSLMLLHFTNFLVFYTPRFIRFVSGRAQVASRRARFESAKTPEGTWLHKCHACGKTELDDPKLDFRVGADGEDYCDNCRPKKPGEAKTP